MTRATDEITEDTPGQALVITRAHPEIRWASMREFFSSFALDAPDWSMLRLDANPARISLFSAPSAKKRAELLIHDDHQLNWSFGEELGGPIPGTLEITLAGAVCLSVTFRIKRLRQREGCKDFIFRCANILGFGTYQIEHEDAQHLRVSLSRRQDVEQLAYRDGGRVSLRVPTIRARANYQRASVAYDGTPRRAHDDSYFVFSWDSQLIHFVSSTKIDWDTPRSEWQKGDLREVIINLPGRNLSYQHDASGQELPLHLLSHLYLSRVVIGGSCQASLSLFYRGVSAFQSGSLLLAESSLCESHDEAFESLSLLASSLAKALKLPRYADLFPSGQGVSLGCVSPSADGLIIAGGHSSAAIAYLPSAPERYSARTAKAGTFTDISRGDSILLACSTGDIHEQTSTQWIEHRPIGRAHLRAIAQSQTGEALAVGDNGRVFFKRPNRAWEGIPKESLPHNLQSASLIGVIFLHSESSSGARADSNPSFLVASSDGILFRCEVKEQELVWVQRGVLDEPISRLFASGGRYWAVLARGKLVEIQVNPYTITSEAMFFPAKGKIITVFRGVSRELIAVADDGWIYSLFGAGSASIKSIQLRRIEAAHAILDRSLGEMSEAGLWSNIALGWARINELPPLTWSAAAYQDGLLYLVGGDRLLRISGRL